MYHFIGLGCFSFLTRAKSTGNLFYSVKILQVIYKHFCRSMRINFLFELPVVLTNGIVRARLVSICLRQLLRSDTGTSIRLTYLIV